MKKKASEREWITMEIRLEAPGEEENGSERPPYTPRAPWGSIYGARDSPKKPPMPEGQIDNFLL